jgi:hypothetical protein
MPFYRFEIATHRSTPDALRCIEQMLAPPRSFFRGPKFGFRFAPATTRPFVGTVEGKKFRIHRDIYYRNSFLPMIRGHVDSGPVGTRVRVTMYLHPFVAVFMAVWFSGVGSALYGFLHSANPVADMTVVFPLGMLAFGVVMVCAGFFPEAIKARRLLEQALADARR